VSEALTLGPISAPAPATTKPFGLWKVLAAVVGSFLVVVLSSIALLTIALISGLTTFEAIRVNPTVPSIYAQSISYAPFFVFAAAIMPWLTGLPFNEAWRSVGFCRPTRRDIAWGLGGGLLLLAVVNGLGTLEQQLFHLRAEEASKFLRASNSPFYAATFFVMAAALAPVSEEIVFRGMIFNSLRLRMPIWAAATLCGLLFGLAHADISDMTSTIANIVPLGIGGAILAMIYERTRNLVAPMIAHSLMNGTAVIVTLFFGLHI
jgi:membrane protease YdiL (CAAX protease family)